MPAKQILSISGSLCRIIWQRSYEQNEFTDELMNKYQLPSDALHRLHSAEHRQEEAITRLYLAIGFALGAGLSRASEEKSSA
jgi:hypothetical protein